MLIFNRLKGVIEFTTKTDICYNFYLKEIFQYDISEIKHEIFEISKYQNLLRNFGTNFDKHRLIKYERSGYRNSI